jgi:hypothetical protein
MTMSYGRYVQGNYYLFRRPTKPALLILTYIWIRATGISSRLKKPSNPPRSPRPRPARVPRPITTTCSRNMRTITSSRAGRPQDRVFALFERYLEEQGEQVLRERDGASLSRHLRLQLLQDHVPVAL